jgi:hyperosmotically inducible protein
MKRLMMAAVTVAAIVSLAGCQTMTGRTVRQNVDDATLEAQVKARLGADRLANLTQVDVDTVQGVVYLNGVVPTARDKTEAARTAGSVDGVRSVVNNLVVQRATPDAASSPSASPSANVPGPALTGEVVSVDHATGVVIVSTKEGLFNLHFPRASVRDIQRGDRVHVDLGLEPLTR